MMARAVKFNHGSLKWKCFVVSFPFPDIDYIGTKGDGHLGSISAHSKLFIKPHDFNPNCQLDIIKLDLYTSKVQLQNVVDQMSI